MRFSSAAALPSPSSPARAAQVSPAPSEGPRTRPPATSKLAEKKYTNKNTKNQKAGRPGGSVTEAAKAVAEMNSEGSDSFIQQEVENEIRPEMPLYLYAEDPDDFQTEIRRALFDIQDKLAKKKSKKAYEDTLLQLKAMSDKLDQDDPDHEEVAKKTADDPSATNSLNRSEPAIQEHMPMVGSDKLLIQPADPSSTDSVTRLAPYFLQDDQDHDETSDEEMTDEEKKFADYRESWEAIWGKTCGSFEHMTALSSMQFTYYTPGRNPPSSGATTPETLQIFSIKLAEIPADLGWPLSVYGVVAVRDVVDHNRNFLFYCDRNNSQELAQNDPFLRLIGPSRAVVFADRVHFEIELEVKGTTRSQDKALITEGSQCRQIYGGDASTICFENCFCKIEFFVQLVRRTTQATILGVQVVNGGQWPFKYGARVACSSLPGKIIVTKDYRVSHVTDPASGELVMVDSKDGAKLKGARGYLHLTRSVVSVEDQGRLDIDIQAYSESGGIAARRVVSFPAKFSKISTKYCFFRNVKVMITVAWSLVATDKRDVMSDASLI